MLSFFGNHWALDLLDIGIVAVVFYKLYLFIRSTRAVSMFLGLLLIIVSGLLSQFLGLHGLNWIIGSLKTIWLIGFVIVFQPELRRVLSTLGQNPLIRPFIYQNRTDDEVIDIAVSAAFKMSHDRTGALIVLMRNAGMKGVIDTGIPLEARVSEELLLSIFNADSPLHDGATVVQGDQVSAAGCILPLTQNPQLSRALGTRHRAAIGITEESDCLVIVVSEQTGDVSCAKGGQLMRRLTLEALRKLLGEALSGRTLTPA